MMYSPAEIAKRYSDAGGAKTRQSVCKTLVLAVFAGAYIALGAYGSQIVAVGVPVAAVGKFLGALIFPIGLLMVIIAGAELFTGNSLLIISVLNREATPGGLLKNWGLVYIGNFAGGFLTAALLTYSHSYSFLNGEMAQTVVNVAVGKVSLSPGDAFLRGILCNILVCVAVWVSFSAEEAAGKILALFLPIVLFVVSGYEHCVANMYFISAGILVSREYGIAAAGLSWSSMLIKNLLPVTLGNIVGGAGIVGCGYYYVYLAKAKEKGFHAGAARKRA